MSRFGIDYAWGSPSASSLKGAGVTFVCRYVSTPGNSKNVRAAEVKAFSQAGIDIVLVFETTAGRALAGKSAGAADARAALAQAYAVNMPQDRPLYFAVDFDASQSQQGAINFYFQGVTSVLGKGRTGVYGGYWVVKRLFDADLVAYGWQTFAWSGGNWDKRAQLQQYSNDHTLAGVSCDYNRAVADDFGQWRIGASSGLPKHKNNSRKLSDGDSGTDVRHFQAELNNRLKARKHSPISTDGRYGPATEKAKHIVTYALGFPEGVVKRAGATPKVQEYVDTPSLRPKSYLERAKQRKEQSPAPPQPDPEPAPKPPDHRLVRDLKGEELLVKLSHVAAKKYKLIVWQWKPGPVGGHSPGSYHYQTYPDGVGRAFDAYGSSIAMYRFGRWVNKHAPQVTEGIHNPGLSRKNGQSVSSSYWGSATWSAHRNHVHVAV